MESKLSNLITVIRFPLALAVVFIHVGRSPFFLRELGENHSVADFICVFLSELIFNVILLAVPIFFIISGYLMYYNMSNWDNELYIQKIKKRFFTLVVPYFAWNTLLIVVWMFLPTLIGGIIHHREVGEIMQNLGAINWHQYWDINRWGDNSSGPIDLPFWFLRDLIVISIVSPIIYWTIKSLGVIIISLLFVAVIFWYWPFDAGLRISSLFYFSLGVYLATSKNNIIEIAIRYKNIWRIVACTTLFVKFFLFIDYSPNISRFIDIVMVISSLVSIISLLVNRITPGCLSVSKKLEQYTFFVYAFHYPLLISLHSLISRYISPQPDPCMDVVRYVVIPLIICGISMLTMNMLKKISPVVLSILNGKK
ncbi:MAG: acyltransferase [Bacteroidales bacterium]|nr:acyltransferase [Bacteroidales bacterium]